MSFSAHKRVFHLFGVTSGLFLARPSTCYNLFQVAPFVTNDDLQNVLTCKFIKINFMLDIVTKWGKCYYKMRSFLVCKTGQVVLQSSVGITEWHNFYCKMGGGSIPKWGNHYKEKQDSTKGFRHLSFRATIPESKTIGIAKSCLEVWYQTMDIVQSKRFFLKKLSQYKILEKVATLLFCFVLWKVSLSHQRAI